VPGKDAPRKKRYWQVDVSRLQSLRRMSRVERMIVQPVRSMGKMFLVGLAFAYPVLLVLTGIVFGGFAFWATLGGSFLFIYLLLSRLGLARNFQSWDISLKRSIPALSLGFLLALGFYLGIIYLKVWFLAVVFAALSMGVLYISTRKTR